MSRHEPMPTCSEDCDGSPHRDRLKRCPECAKFFVDYARPKNSERCSTLCTWRFWNRERVSARRRRVKERRR